MWECRKTLSFQHSPLNGDIISHLKAEISNNSFLTSSIPPTEATDSGKTIIQSVLNNLIENKAIDVRGLLMNGVSDITDYMVIASGSSKRHVKGLSDKVQSMLSDLSETPLNADGRDSQDWIVLDYGNFIIHLFHEPARQFYQIDELWSAAEEITLDKEHEKVALRLRTGIYT